MRQQMNSPVIELASHRLWALQETAPQLALQRCLVCNAGGTRLALPIEPLRSIEPLVNVMPVPHMPPWVRGVTNVRGTVVGVVDLGEFLGVGPSSVGLPSPATGGLSMGTIAAGRMLVCASGPRLVAFAVADARDVADYDQSQVLPTGNLPGRAARYAAGLVHLEDGVAILLNVERLLGDDELTTG